MVQEYIKEAAVRHRFVWCRDKVIAAHETPAKPGEFSAPTCTVAASASLIKITPESA